MIAPMIALHTPLAGGEDADAYAKLLADTTACVRPTGILEEMWLRDAVNHYWEIERLRRFRAGRLAAVRAEGMAALLRSLGETVSGADELGRRWSAREITAIGDVRDRLERAGLDHAAALGSAFALHLDEFERIEQMIASLEARRAAALREIGFHRADFADRLAAATQMRPIEEAELAEVPPPAPSPSEAAGEAG
ncbi:MAG TPA: hypothetical protein VKX28_21195 [Xanthobacteraceae bacterium]|nr:hypothetical protein [Xanthobacteraceae bacterium]